MTVSEWADRFRVLTTKSSSEAGPWRTDRAPYMREPMDCLSYDSPCEEVVIIAATQTGKTEAGNNWIGSAIDLAPGPIMMVQPTIDMGKRYSKQRIQPMIDATARLRDKILPARSRDSGNTTLVKEFPGGFLLITGANSAAGLRSMPVRDLFLDEVDAYPHDVDGEGDPISLAERRQSTFWRRKRLKTSTPTTKGASRIESAFLATEQSYYHVPCPHCKELQKLSWSGVRWPHGKPEDACYVCAHCGAEIYEHQKSWMLHNGVWIAAVPENATERRRGFHISALYSPLGLKSWADCVMEFLQATQAKERGDVSLLKTFVNTVLAETWEEGGDRPDVAALSKRAEAYSLREVPAGVLVITAGVDVQGDRLQIHIVGWGADDESWICDWAVLYGDPAQAETWKALEAYLARPLAREDGATLKLSAVAIDSGGHHTHEVYQACRANRAKHWLAVKGSSMASRPILGKPTDVDINHKGAKLKKAAQVWSIGTDTAKALIYGRMKVASGPGCVHFSHDLEADYYAEVTSENLVTRYLKGRPRLEWVKPAGRRNEGLDTLVYALAAAVYCGLTRWKAPDWARLAKQLAPKEKPAALADKEEITLMTKRPIKIKRNAGSFVNRWR